MGDKKMSKIKDKIEIEILKGLYTGPDKDEYIYRDRRTTKLLKFAKIVIGLSISVLPAIGPLVEGIMKLFA